jgi:PEP-CTERM motif
MLYRVARLTFAALLVCLLTAAVPRPATAATIAVSISDVSGQFGFLPGVTAGWEFIVNSPITVTHLGFFDSGQDGLGEAHPVGLWNDLTQGATLLVSGTVATGDPLTNQWRYTDVTDTPLAPGTYRIGALYPSSIDPVQIQASGFSTAPEIAFTHGAFANTGVLSFPLLIEPAFAPGAFGPNFQFINPAAVPEPGTLALTGLGMLGLGVWLRRRKKRA